ncbi:MAG: Fic family protein [Candidatus Omnitrophota bacterium]|nr:Fic family protein [Candidatus Omnitrophota bacterium]
MLPEYVENAAKHLGANPLGSEITRVLDDAMAKAERLFEMIHALPPKVREQVAKDKQASPHSKVLEGLREELSQVEAELTEADSAAVGSIDKRVWEKPGAGELRKSLLQYAAELIARRGELAARRQEVESKIQDWNRMGEALGPEFTTSILDAVGKAGQIKRQRSELRGGEEAERAVWTGKHAGYLRDQARAAIYEGTKRRARGEAITDADLMRLFNRFLRRDLGRTGLEYDEIDTALRALHGTADLSKPPYSNDPILFLLGLTASRRITLDVAETEAEEVRAARSGLEFSRRDFDKMSAWAALGAGLSMILGGTGAAAVASGETARNSAFLGQYGKLIAQGIGKRFAFNSIDWWQMASAMPWITRDELKKVKFMPATAPEHDLDDDGLAIFSRYAGTIQRQISTGVEAALQKNPGLARQVAGKMEKAIRAGTTRTSNPAELLPSYIERSTEYLGENALGRDIGAVLDEAMGTGQHLFDMISRLPAMVRQRVAQDKRGAPHSKVMSELENELATVNARIAELEDTAVGRVTSDRSWRELDTTELKTAISNFVTGIMEEQAELAARRRELEGEIAVWWREGEFLGAEFTTSILDMADQAGALKPMTPKRPAAVRTQKRQELLTGLRSELRANQETITGEELFGLLNGKYEVRNLLRSGPIAQPEWFIAFRRDPAATAHVKAHGQSKDFTDRSYLDAYADPDDIKDFRAIAKEIARAVRQGDSAEENRYQLPLIFKPNNEELGRGILVLSFDEDGDVMMTMAQSDVFYFETRHTDRVRDYLEQSGVVKSIREPEDEGIVQFVIDRRQEDLAGILEGVWQAIAADELWTLYDSGMLEPKLPFLTDVSGRSYETSFAFTGSLLGDSWEPIMSGEMRHYDTFARIGSNEYLSNITGRVRFDTYPAAEMFEPLYQVVEIPESRRREFEDKTHALLREELNHLTARLRERGIEVDMNVNVRLDIRWLAPAPASGGFPVPVLIEMHAGPRDTRDSRRSFPRRSELRSADWEEVRSDLKTVAGFLSKSDPLPDRADVILIAGNDDLGVFEAAANIHERVNYIVISGGHGRLTEPLKEAVRASKAAAGIEDLDNKSEAAIIRDYLAAQGVPVDKIIFLAPEPSEASLIGELLEMRGVPADKIVLEEESTNTPENFEFSFLKMHELGIPHHSIIYMQKPIQQMRTKATFTKVAYGDHVTDTGYLPNADEIQGFGYVAPGTAPDVDAMTEQEIRGLIDYVAGYRRGNKWVLGEWDKLEAYQKKGSIVHVVIDGETRAAFERLKSENKKIRPAENVLRELGVDARDFTRVVFPFVGHRDTMRVEGNSLSFIEALIRLFPELRDVYLIDKGYPADDAAAIKKKLEADAEAMRGAGQPKVTVHIITEDFKQFSLPASTEGKTVFIDKYPGDIHGQIRQKLGYLRSIAKYGDLTLSLPPVTKDLPFEKQFSRWASLTGYESRLRFDLWLLPQSYRESLGRSAAPLLAAGLEELLRGVQPKNYETLKTWLHEWYWNQREDFVMKWYEAAFAQGSELFKWIYPRQFDSGFLGEVGNTSGSREASLYFEDDDSALYVRETATGMEIEVGRGRSELRSEPEFAQAQGKRSGQLDSYVNRVIDFKDVPKHGKGRILAVMDGHGTRFVSNLLSEILEEEFHQALVRSGGDVRAALGGLHEVLDARTREMDYGSTFSMVYVPEDEAAAYILQLGDSPILVFSELQDIMNDGLIEHNVGDSEERQKVKEKLEGLGKREMQDFMFWQNPRDKGWSVIDTSRDKDNALQASRIYGDRSFRDFTLREPHIERVELGHVTDTIHILVASDGIFANNYADSRGARNTGITNAVFDDDAGATELLARAGGEAAPDNTTILMWKLEPGWAAPAEEIAAVPAVYPEKKTLYRRMISVIMPPFMVFTEGLIALFAPLSIGALLLHLAGMLDGHAFVEVTHFVSYGLTALFFIHAAQVILKLLAADPDKRPVIRFSGPVEVVVGIVGFVFAPTAFAQIIGHWLDHVGHLTMATEEYRTRRWTYQYWSALFAITGVVTGAIMMFTHHHPIIMHLSAAAWGLSAIFGLLKAWSSHRTRKRIVKSGVRITADSEPAYPAEKEDRDLQLNAQDRRKTDPVFERIDEAIEWYRDARKDHPGLKFVILGRHLRSVLNHYGFTHGRDYFAPVTTGGLEQGKQLLAHLDRLTSMNFGKEAPASEFFDGLYSSDSERAYDLVSPFGEPKIVRALGEISLYPVAGIPREHAEAALAGMYEHFAADPSSFEIPGIVSGRQLGEELEEFGERLATGHEERVLIGTHRLAMIYLMMKMLKVEDEKFEAVANQLGHSPTAGLSALAYDPQTEKWRLLVYGDDSYLTNEFRDKPQTERTLRMRRAAGNFLRYRLIGLGRMLERAASQVPILRRVFPPSEKGKQLTDYYPSLESFWNLFFMQSSEVLEGQLKVAMIKQEIGIGMSDEALFNALSIRMYLAEHGRTNYLNRYRELIIDDIRLIRQVLKRIVNDRDAAHRHHDRLRDHIDHLIKPLNRIPAEQRAYRDLAVNRVAAMLVPILSPSPQVQSKARSELRAEGEDKIAAALGLPDPAGVIRGIQQANRNTMTTERLIDAVNSGSLIGVRIQHGNLVDTLSKTERLAVLRHLILHEDAADRITSFIDLPRMTPKIAAMFHKEGVNTMADFIASADARFPGRSSRVPEDYRARAIPDIMHVVPELFRLYIPEFYKTHELQRGFLSVMLTSDRHTHDFRELFEQMHLSAADIENLFGLPHAASILRKIEIARDSVVEVDELIEAVNEEGLGEIQAATVKGQTAPLSRIEQTEIVRHLLIYHHAAGKITNLKAIPGITAGREMYLKGLGIDNVAKLLDALGHTPVEPMRPRDALDEAGEDSHFDTVVLWGEERKKEPDRPVLWPILKADIIESFLGLAPELLHTPRLGESAAFTVLNMFMEKMVGLGFESTYGDFFERMGLLPRGEARPAPKLQARLDKHRKTVEMPPAPEGLSEAEEALALTAAGEAPLAVLDDLVKLFPIGWNTPVRNVNTLKGYFQGQLSSLSRQLRNAERSAHVLDVILKELIKDPHAYLKTSQIVIKARDILLIEHIGRSHENETIKTVLENLEMIEAGLKTEDSPTEEQDDLLREFRTRGIVREVQVTILREALKDRRRVSGPTREEQPPDQADTATGLSVSRPQDDEADTADIIADDVFIREGDDANEPLTTERLLERLSRARFVNVGDFMDLLTDWLVQHEDDGSFIRILDAIDEDGAYLEATVFEWSNATVDVEPKGPVKLRANQFPRVIGDSVKERMEAIQTGEASDIAGPFYDLFYYLHETQNLQINREAFDRVRTGALPGYSKNIIQVNPPEDILRFIGPTVGLTSEDRNPDYYRQLFDRAGKAVDNFREVTLKTQVEDPPRHFALTEVMMITARKLQSKEELEEKLRAQIYEEQVNAYYDLDFMLAKYVRAGTIASNIRGEKVETLIDRLTLTTKPDLSHIYIDEEGFAQDLRIDLERGFLALERLDVLDSERLMANLKRLTAFAINYGSPTDLAPILGAVISARAHRVPGKKTADTAGEVYELEFKRWVFPEDGLKADDEAFAEFEIHQGAIDRWNDNSRVKRFPTMFGADRSELRSEEPIREPFTIYPPGYVPPHFVMQLRDEKIIGAVANNEIETTLRGIHAGTPLDAIGFTTDGRTLSWNRTDQPDFEAALSSLLTRLSAKASGSEIYDVSTADYAEDSLEAPPTSGKILILRMQRSELRGGVDAALVLPPGSPMAHLAAALGLQAGRTVLTPLGAGYGAIALPPSELLGRLFSAVRQKREGIWDFWDEPGAWILTHESQPLGIVAAVGHGKIAHSSLSALRHPEWLELGGEEVLRRYREEDALWKTFRQNRLADFLSSLGRGTIRAGEIEVYEVSDAQYQGHWKELRIAPVEPLGLPVLPGVFPPTHIFLKEFLEWFAPRIRPRAKILIVGSGAGPEAVFLGLLSRARGLELEIHAVDAFDAELENTKASLERYGLSEPVKVWKSDAFDRVTEKYDYIIFDAPQPRPASLGRALDARTKDPGGRLTRRILEGFPARLRENAVFYLMAVTDPFAAVGMDRRGLNIRRLEDAPFWLEIRPGGRSELRAESRHEPILKWLRSNGRYFTMTEEQVRIAERFLNDEISAKAAYEEIDAVSGSRIYGRQILQALAVAVTTRDWIHRIRPDFLTTFMQGLILYMGHTMNEGIAMENIRDALDVAEDKKPETARAAAQAAGRRMDKWVDEDDVHAEIEKYMGPAPEGADRSAIGKYQRMGFMIAALTKMKKHLDRFEREGRPATEQEKDRMTHAYLNLMKAKWQHKQDPEAAQKIIYGALGFYLSLLRTLPEEVELELIDEYLALTTLKPYEDVVREKDYKSEDPDKVTLPLPAAVINWILATSYHGGEEGLSMLLAEAEQDRAYLYRDVLAEAIFFARTRNADDARLKKAALEKIRKMLVPGFRMAFTDYRLPGQVPVDFAPEHLESPKPHSVTDYRLLALKRIQSDFDALGPDHDRAAIEEAGFKLRHLRNLFEHPGWDAGLAGMMGVIFGITFFAVLWMGATLIAPAATTPATALVWLPVFYAAMFYFVSLELVQAYNEAMSLLSMQVHPRDMLEGRHGNIRPLTLGGGNDVISTPQENFLAYFSPRRQAFFYLLARFQMFVTGRRQGWLDFYGHYPQFLAYTMLTGEETLRLDQQRRQPLAKATFLYGPAMLEFMLLVSALMTLPAVIAALLFPAYLAGVLGFMIGLLYGARILNWTGLFRARNPRRALAKTRAYAAPGMDAIREALTRGVRGDRSGFRQALERITEAYGRHLHYIYYDHISRDDITAFSLGALLDEPEYDKPFRGQAIFKVVEHLADNTADRTVWELAMLTLLHDLALLLRAQSLDGMSRTPDEHLSDIYDLLEPYQETIHVLGYHNRRYGMLLWLFLKINLRYAWRTLLRGDFVWALFLLVTAPFAALLALWQHHRERPQWNKRKATLNRVLEAALQEEDVFSPGLEEIRNGATPNESRTLDKIWAYASAAKFGFEAPRKVPASEALKTGPDVVNLGIYLGPHDTVFSMLQEGGRDPHTNVVYISEDDLRFERRGGRVVATTKSGIMFAGDRPALVNFAEPVVLHYVKNQTTEVTGVGKKLRRHGIPVPEHYRAVDYFDQKDITMAILKDAGIPVPETVSIIVDRHARRAIRGRRRQNRQVHLAHRKDKHLLDLVHTVIQAFFWGQRDSEVVAKPVSGAKGDKVRFIDEKKSLRDDSARAIMQHIRRGENFMFQRRIEAFPVYRIKETGDPEASKQRLDHNLRVTLSPDEAGNPQVNDSIVRINDWGKVINISKGAATLPLEELVRMAFEPEEQSSRLEALKREIERVTLAGYHALTQAMRADGVLGPNELPADYMGFDLIVALENGAFKAYVIEVNGHMSGGPGNLDRELRSRSKKVEEMRARIEGTLSGITEEIQSLLEHDREEVLDDLGITVGARFEQLTKQMIHQVFLQTDLDFALPKPDQIGRAVRGFISQAKRRGRAYKRELNGLNGASNQRSERRTIKGLINNRLDGSRRQAPDPEDSQRSELRVEEYELTDADARAVYDYVQSDFGLEGILIHRWDAVVRARETGERLEVWDALKAAESVFQSEILQVAGPLIDGLVPVFEDRYFYDRKNDQRTWYDIFELRAALDYALKEEIAYRTRYRRLTRTVIEETALALQEPSEATLTRLDQSIGYWFWERVEPLLHGKAQPDGSLIELPDIETFAESMSRRTARLIEYLQNTENSPLTRASTAIELGKLAPGNERAVSALTAILEMPDTQEYHSVRQAAATALGAMRERARTSLPVLLRVAGDPKSYAPARKAAINAIVRIDPSYEPAVELFSRLVRDYPESFLVSAARNALLIMSHHGSGDAGREIMTLLKTFKPRRTSEISGDDFPYILGRIGLSRSLQTASDPAVIENYERAFAYFQEGAKARPNPTLDDLIALHKFIMEGLVPGWVDTGKYDVDWAGLVRGRDPRVDLELPPKFDVRSRDTMAALENFFAWFEANYDNEDGIAFAVEAYTRLVTIHPFYDANGRAMRLFLDWILYGKGYFMAEYPEVLFDAMTTPEHVLANAVKQTAADRSELRTEEGLEEQAIAVIDKLYPRIRGASGLPGKGGIQVLLSRASQELDARRFNGALEKARQAEQTYAGTDHGKVESEQSRQIKKLFEELVRTLAILEASPEAEAAKTAKAAMDDAAPDADFLKRAAEARLAARPQPVGKADGATVSAQSRAGARAQGGQDRVVNVRLGDGYLLAAIDGHGPQGDDVAQFVADRLEPIFTERMQQRAVARYAMEDTVYRLIYELFQENQANGVAVYSGVRAAFVYVTDFDKTGRARATAVTFKDSFYKAVTDADGTMVSSATNRLNIGDFGEAETLTDLAFLRQFKPREHIVDIELRSANSTLILATDGLSPSDVDAALTSQETADEILDRVKGVDDKTVIVWRASASQQRSELRAGSTDGRMWGMRWPAYGAFTGRWGEAMRPVSAKHQRRLQTELKPHASWSARRGLKLAREIPEAYATYLEKNREVIEKNLGRLRTDLGKPVKIALHGHYAWFEKEGGRPEFTIPWTGRFGKNSPGELISFRDDNGVIHLPIDLFIPFIDPETQHHLAVEAAMAAQIPERSLIRHRLRMHTRKLWLESDAYAFPLRDAMKQEIPVQRIEPLVGSLPHLQGLWHLIAHDARLENAELSDEQREGVMKQVYVEHLAQPFFVAPLISSESLREFLAPWFAEPMARALHDHIKLGRVANMDELTTDDFRRASRHLQTMMTLGVFRRLMVMAEPEVEATLMGPMSEDDWNVVRELAKYKDQDHEDLLREILKEKDVVLIQSDTHHMGDFLPAIEEGELPAGTLVSFPLTERRDAENQFSLWAIIVGNGGSWKEIAEAVNDYIRTGNTEKLTDFETKKYVRMHDIDKIVKHFDVLRERYQNGVDIRFFPDFTLSIRDMISSEGDLKRRYREYLSQLKEYRKETQASKIVLAHHLPGEAFFDQALLRIQKPGRSKPDLLHTLLRSPDFFGATDVATVATVASVHVTYDLGIDFFAPLFKIFQHFPGGSFAAPVIDLIADLPVSTHMHPGETYVFGNFDYVFFTLKKKPDDHGRLDKVPAPVGSDEEDPDGGVYEEQESEVSEMAGAGSARSELRSEDEARRLRDWKSQEMSYVSASQQGKLLRLYSVIDDIHRAVEGAKKVNSNPFWSLLNHDIPYQHAIAKASPADLKAYEKYFGDLIDFLNELGDHLDDFHVYYENEKRGKEAPAVTNLLIDRAITDSRDGKFRSGHRPAIVAITQALAEAISHVRRVREHYEQKVRAIEAADRVPQHETEAPPEYWAERLLHHVEAVSSGIKHLSDIASVSPDDKTDDELASLYRLSLDIEKSVRSFIAMPVDEPLIAITDRALGRVESRVAVIWEYAPQDFSATRLSLDRHLAQSLEVLGTLKDFAQDPRRSWRSRLEGELQKALRGGVFPVNADDLMELVDMDFDPNGRLQSIDIRHTRDLLTGLFDYERDDYAAAVFEAVVPFLMDWISGQRAEGLEDGLPLLAETFSDAIKTAEAGGGGKIRFLFRNTGDQAVVDVLNQSESLASLHFPLRPAEAPTANAAPRVLNERAERVRDALQGLEVPLTAFDDGSVYEPLPFDLSQAIFEQLAAITPLQGKNFLQINPGDLRVSLYAEDMNVTAVEQQPEIAEQARGILLNLQSRGLGKNITYVQQDPVRTEDESYWRDADVVFFSYAEPVGEAQTKAYRSALEEKMRLMKPGAVLALHLISDQLDNEPEVSAFEYPVILRDMADFTPVTRPLPGGHYLQLYTAPERSELRNNAVAEMDVADFVDQHDGTGTLMISRSELRELSRQQWESLFVVAYNGAQIRVVVYGADDGPGGARLEALTALKNVVVAHTDVKGALKHAVPHRKTVHASRHGADAALLGELGEELLKQITFLRLGQEHELFVLALLFIISDGELPYFSEENHHLTASRMLQGELSEYLAQQVVAWAA